MKGVDHRRNGMAEINQAYQMPYLILSNMRVAKTRAFNLGSYGIFVDITGHFLAVENFE